MFVRIAPFLIVLFVGLISCTKENGNIVISGQNQKDKLSLFRTDTLSLITRTIREDSLPGNNLSYALLGELNDPVLGKSKASLFAKMNIIEPENNFPNTREPDSAILYIPLVEGMNFYGNRGSSQHLRIYPLNETITASNVYYQNQTVQYHQNNVSDYFGSLYLQKIDSIGYRKTKIALKQGLIVKLSKAFARSLMQMPAEAYKNNEGLAKYFKGIAIIPENDELLPGEGGHAVFDITNTQSINSRAKILLYYNDTSTFVFGFDGKSASVNNGQTGPYPPKIVEQLLNPKGHFKTTYVQALCGLKTQIEIPYLLNLINQGNIGVNNAELYLYTNNIRNATYFAPPRMNIFQPNSKTGKRNKFIADALESLGSFGGIYNETGHYYKFVITRHLQNVLNAKAFNGEDINYGLFFALPSDNPVIGARTGIDHTKTRLIITYTKPN